MVIWKFPIPFMAEPSTHQVPAGAKFLTAQIQLSAYVGGGGIMLWGLVDPEAPLEARTIQIVGTGHEVPANARYIATVQDGALVWHVFEINWERGP